MAELSIDDILGQMTLPEDKIPFCVKADLYLQWEQAEQAYQAAKAQDSGSVAGASKAVKAAAQAVLDLEAEMEKNTITLHLRGIPRGTWKLLKDKHPAPEGSFEEFDTEGFRPDLLAACCLTPTMSAEKAALFISSMTDGQWEEIERKLTILNKKAVSVPKSRGASETLRSSTKK